MRRVRPAMTIFAPRMLRSIFHQAHDIRLQLLGTGHEPFLSRRSTRDDSRSNALDYPVPLTPRIPNRSCSLISPNFQGHPNDVPQCRIACP